MPPEICESNTPSSASCRFSRAEQVEHLLVLVRQPVHVAPDFAVAQAHGPLLERLEGADSNLRLIHLPIHASWLNHVEIYVSVLERRLLTPPDAASLDELAARILRIQASYELLAAPFE